MARSSTSILSIGELYHFYRIFNRSAGAEDDFAVFALPDFSDAQVGIGCQPPVEIDFLQAVLTALFEGGEIKKPEIDGLFHLVDQVTGDKHIRDMGLDDFDG